MKEVEISENVTSIVDAKKIIDKITLVNNRYEESNRNAKSLLSNINRAQSSIEEVCNGKKGRSWGSLDKQALLDLIKEDNNATSKSISSISKLITNNNENSKLLAEMVGALAMLSGLSFEKISETSAELEGIINQIKESSNGNEVQGNHIKRIVISQIEKTVEERKRADKIEYNFGIINDNIREIDKKLKLEKIATSNKIENIETLINVISEKKNEKTLSNQKKKINLLIIFSMTNLIIILGFLFYIITNKYL
ncbi:hypothetical protein EC396_01470 [Lutibacter sp. HS1-25]|uniref:hypothetical protein n=1 Tax=Lutibacter sp. HS1-25 TaxID=2485000 RepID=UPI001012CF42|nr:hypothetical protein [Lutibacter sp. HS1-25]RXP63502.1 hypothetical protein EC396_01470 [Lutibacter sp. HS1-25]